jgi:hypothetical protein
METYIVYVGNGEVLGAAEAEDHQKAAQAVVNQTQWPGDPFAAEVNVARATDPDMDISDSVSPTDPGVELVESDLRVVITN